MLFVSNHVGTVVSSVIIRSAVFPLLPPVDSIRAVMFVWRLRVKIIRTVLC